MSIAGKELFAIVMVVDAWGTLQQQQKILFHCENPTMVNIWEKVAPNLLASWHW